MAAGRPVRRRRDPRDPPPAVRRFFTKVLYDMGYVDFTEPFTRLLNQGMVRDERLRDEQVAWQPGARCPTSWPTTASTRSGSAWSSPVRPRTTSTGRTCRPPGLASSWPARGGWRATSRPSPGVDPATGDVALRKATHRALHDGAHAVETFRFNSLVARDDGARQRHPQGDRQRARSLPTRRCARRPRRWRSCCRSSRPSPPRRCGSGSVTSPSVALAGWPEVDESLLVEDVVTCVVQVPARCAPGSRSSPTIGEDELRELALADPQRAALAGRTRRPHGDRAGAEAGQRRARA